MSQAQLTILCWDHPRCTHPVRAAIRVWSATHPDIDVTVKTRPLDAFNDQPVETIASSADLLLVDHPMMGTVARTGTLLPLDEVLDAGVLEELATDSIARSHATYTWEGQQWATAVDAACQVAVANEDGLRWRGVEAPASWDAVLRLARDVPGTVAIPLHPTDTFLSLVSISANAHPAAADRTIDELLTVDSVAVLVELARLVDARSFDCNPPRLLDLMSSGELAEVPAYAPLLFGYTNYQRPGPPSRRLRFCDIPSFGSQPVGAVLGGAGLAVSATTSHPREAAKFAAWMAGRNAQRDVVVVHDGQPASRTTWDDPEADRLVGGFFSGTRRTMDASYIRPRDAWWPGFQEAAGIRLVDLLRGSAAPRTIHRELIDLLDRVRDKEPSA